MLRSHLILLAELVAQDNTTLVFPQDVIIDNESRKLYVLSNNLQIFMQEDFDPLTTNFFITSLDLDTLTSMCKPGVHYD